MTMPTASKSVQPNSPEALRAKASKALVEAAARAALRPDEPLPDLMIAGIPFTPALWMIVVEPLQPRDMTDGGIAVVDLSQDAEEYMVTVGRVLSAGPAAMEGQTTGGVPLNHFTKDITTPAQLIGQWVVYQKHVGQELTLRKTGQLVKVMKLTELLGVTEDRWAWRFYI